ncbi:MAG: DUF4236 domain-containing protein, partial [Bacteroidaceae bacterium]|nr:DUF4236 domain-containing protein [Bacteroidaceae bacterium]
MLIKLLTSKLRAQLVLIMGVRFNKRIKVLPYVTANVGKSGVSLTIGPKGKTLNIGSTGVNV